jgi:hypothetical protein
VCLEAVDCVTIAQATQMSVAVKYGSVVVQYLDANLQPSSFLAADAIVCFPVSEFFLMLAQRYFVLSTYLMPSPSGPAMTAYGSLDPINKKSESSS